MKAQETDGISRGVKPMGVMSPWSSLLCPLHETVFEWRSSTLKSLYHVGGPCLSFSNQKIILLEARADGFLSEYLLLLMLWSNSLEKPNTRGPIAVCISTLLLALWRENGEYTWRRNVIFILKFRLVLSLYRSSSVHASTNLCLASFYGRSTKFWDPTRVTGRLPPTYA